MKLAQILPQQALPAGSATRYAPVPPSLGIGEGLQELGAVGSRFAAALARAEEGKDKHQDALDALSAVTTAGDALDRAETDLKLGKRDPDTGEVLAPPAGHRDYVDLWRAHWDTIRETAMAGAKTPQAKFVIEKSMGQLFGHRLAEARKYSNGLFVDQFSAGFEQNVEALERRIARERDPERVQALEAQLGRAFDMAGGVIPLKTLQGRARQAEERIDTARALMDAETDPLGTMAKLRPPLEPGGPPSPYRLSTDKATALAEAIGGRYDRQVTQQETVRKAAQALIDKEQTEAYHAETSDLYAAAKSKLASTEQVEEWRRKYRGRAGLDEDYLRLTTILEEPRKPVKEWKSDPKVEARVMAQVELINPTITRDELIRLNESELLDNNDLKYALGRLRQAQEHQRTLGATTQGQGQEQARRDHAQAEQELRARIMGPDSFFKQVDEKKERLFGQALTQLRTRSSAYGGKEAPLDVVDAMLPNLLKATGAQTLMRAEEARAGLTFPTETALVAARKAGRITESYYREQWQRFRVIEQAEADLQQNAAGGGTEAARALERLRGGKAAPAPAAPDAPRTMPRGGAGTGRLRDLSEQGGR